jgi:hypothetical protein
MTRRTTPTALRRPPIDEPESKERPTVAPPFDVVAFARESDSKLRAVGVTPPIVSDSPELSEHTMEDPVSEMRERFALGDFSGALELAELIMAAEPGNLDAAECGEDCRTTLEGMLASKLGSLDRVPIVMVPPAELRWLAIDHRSGFILSLVDGASSIDLILDVCGMPKLDALRIVDELVKQRIIALR